MAAGNGGEKQKTLRLARRVFSDKEITIKLDILSI
jgi:hypothetical protein